MAIEEAKCCLLCKYSTFHYPFSIGEYWCEANYGSFKHEKGYEKLTVRVWNTCEKFFKKET
jgi:hypothetical protein